MKDAVRQAVDQQVLLGLRVIFGSFLMGVYAFTIISVIMYFDKASDPDFVAPLESNATLLTYIALGYIVLAIPLSSMLFKRFLKTHIHENPHVIVANIRSAMLVRLAVFEGAALFAATGILIGALDGFLVENPIIWINLVPIAYFTLHILMNWPTTSKIVYTYENNFR